MLRRRPRRSSLLCHGLPAVSSRSAPWLRPRGHAASTENLPALQWRLRHLRRRVIAAMTTRSFTLARLRRHREAFLNPRLPERCLAGDGPGRLIAVMVEVQRNHALAAEVEGAKGGDARPRLVEPQQGVVRTLA